MQIILNINIIITMKKVFNYIGQYFKPTYSGPFPSEILTVIKGLLMISFLDIITSFIRYVGLHKDAKKYSDLGLNLAGILLTIVISLVSFFLVRKFSGVRRKVVCIVTLVCVVVGFYEIPTLMGTEIELVFLK
jgi:hypothetical protein